MSAGEPEAKVAVLVDCENADPAILDYALRVAAQFGRVVLRRGFGSHTALANKWQTVLVQQAFTPCLQYAYAAGKNTSDIALAMDAIEALFDQRATTFCLVTSDSDFAGLCRKLRERGATVHVIGEAKTPEDLRNASDQFFQWVAPEAVVATPPGVPAVPVVKAPAAPKPKQRPRSVVSAVKLLAADSATGRITVSELGSYLRRTDPSFSPQTYGHSGLVGMLKTYDLLDTRQEAGSHWTVALASPVDVTGSTTNP
ncbi:NYN domain-containing protein [Leptothrix discophora]|uniref:NYN domain-containing protein n=1 Tax=Leptothrix discophora TaxID=89 RepID=A0ABT9G172_LEPDI|nr:NYN domain-containing protein [Leptothrix discophora]MDP4300032.1 NYN domain-containing protein [Leptothrix discophora]